MWINTNFEHFNIQCFKNNNCWSTISITLVICCSILNIIYYNYFPQLLSRKVHLVIAQIPTNCSFSDKFNFVGSWCCFSFEFFLCGLILDMIFFTIISLLLSGLLQLGVAGYCFCCCTITALAAFNIKHIVVGEQQSSINNIIFNIFYLFNLITQY